MKVGSTIRPWKPACSRHGLLARPCFDADPPRVVNKYRESLRAHDSEGRGEEAVHEA